MGSKKLIAVLIFFVFATVSYAAEIPRHLQKENAFTFKIGSHYYKNNDDALDFWEVDEDDLNTIVFEFAYEKKVKQIIGLEFALGRFDSNQTYNNVFFVGDSSKIDIENIYFSPSAKLNLPLNDTFIFYFGGGPDIYWTQTDYKYEESGFTYSVDDNFISFGLHGVVGIEMFIMKNPTAYDFYDVPLSLVFEYKYSWVEVQDADEKIINDVNDALSSSFSKHDLDVGGHKFFVGLKWHF